MYHREQPAAKAIGLPYRTFRKYRLKGLIPVIKIGRVVLYDLAKVKAAIDRLERKEVSL